MLPLNNLTAPTKLNAPDFLDEERHLFFAFYAGLFLDAAGDVNRKGHNLPAGFGYVFNREAAGQEYRFAELFCLDCQVPGKCFSGPAVKTLCF